MTDVYLCAMIECEARHRAQLDEESGAEAYTESLSSSPPPAAEVRRSGGDTCPGAHEHLPVGDPSRV